MVHNRQHIATDWDAVRKVTGAPATKVNECQDEAEKRWKTSSFQKYLYGLAKLMPLEKHTGVVVETGTGISTEVLRQGLERPVIVYDDAGEKQVATLPFVLCSVDSEEKDYPLGVKFVKGTSDSALSRIAMEHPIWDIFIHDSEHDVFTQTFEMEFAWRVLRPGGLLVINAYTWDEHGAFEQFLIRKKQKFWSAGGAGLIRKPSTVQSTLDWSLAWTRAVDIATATRTSTEG